MITATLVEGIGSDVTRFYRLSRGLHIPGTSTWIGGFALVQFRSDPFEGPSYTVCPLTDLTISNNVCNILAPFVWSNVSASSVEQLLSAYLRMLNDQFPEEYSTPL